MSKKYFFGWTNIKWLIVELIKLGSSEESYFSKKRIESGIAFIVMIWGLIIWFIANVQDMPVIDLVMWAGVLGVIAGYMVAQIQKEKLP